VLFRSGVPRSNGQPMVARRGFFVYRNVQPNVAEDGMTMEYGSIERELHIDASPEVVFEVISSPAHIREWWSAKTDLDPVPGATAELVWGDPPGAGSMVSPITVVDAEPPRLFSFRWIYPDGEAATGNNSLLVTFELVPSGAGTKLRLTETGFREKGWEVAVLEEHYQDHCTGWDLHLGTLDNYLARLVSTR
jgi:uncharacterized protein YndB with AHSA1/START domain